MYISTTRLDDYKLFGAKDDLICYGLFCPENFGSYEIGYYDQKAFETDGSIVEKSMTGKVTGSHFANIHPGVGFSL